MLKKLKSLFIVEVDKDTEGAQSGMQESITPSNQKANTNEEGSSALDSSSDGKPKKKFIEVLLKALDRKNLEGIDYIEFKESLKSLDSVIEDEPTRFKSAYAMGKSMGLTKDKLLKSGEYYIGVLKEENSKFQKTYKNQLDLQVRSKENEMNSLNVGIEKRKKQISQLKDEIRKMEAQLEKEKKNIASSNDKLLETKKSFEASYYMLMKQIQSDFEKIKQYIDS